MDGSQTLSWEHGADVDHVHPHCCTFWQIACATAVGAAFFRYRTARRHLHACLGTRVVVGRASSAASARRTAIRENESKENQWKYRSEGNGVLSILYDNRIGRPAGECPASPKGRKADHCDGGWRADLCAMDRWNREVSARCTQ